MSKIAAYKNLIVIGTSHIARESTDIVSKVIDRIKPDFVAIELDTNRYNSLMFKKRASFLEMAKKIGIVNALFISTASSVQSYLGKIVDVEPGSDMLTAVKEAKKNSIKIVLIDQPIERTLQRLDLKVKDILFLIFDGIYSGIRPSLVKMKLAKPQEEDFLNFDLTTVPEDEVINKMLKYLKTKMPKFYRVLIVERNKAMTDNLVMLVKDNPDKTIVAVMGAGHKDAVIHGIKEHFERCINNA